MISFFFYQDEIIIFWKLKIEWNQTFYKIKSDICMLIISIIGIFWSNLGPIDLGPIEPYSPTLILCYSYPNIFGSIGSDLIICRACTTSTLYTSKFICSQYQAGQASISRYSIVVEGRADTVCLLPCCAPPNRVWAIF